MGRGTRKTIYLETKLLRESKEKEIELMRAQINYYNSMKEKALEKTSAFLLEKNMNIKVKKKILCILFALLLFCYQPILIYASDTEHGGGGGKHEIGETSYEGDYTVTDFLEDVSFGVVEFGKFATLIGTTTWGLSTGVGYKDIAEGFKTYNDTLGTGEWIHIDANNNVTYDQELIDLLKLFLAEYAQQHPEEVEKINYRIIHTAAYKQMFKDTMNYGNSLKGDYTVPEGSNTMDFWKKLWNTQNEYDSFPHLLSAPALSVLIDPEKTKDITIGQTLTLFDNYEKNLSDPTKISCFIGEFGGNGWGDETQYHIKVCTYDYTTGSITIDRARSSNQNVRFVWDSDNKVWNGAETGHYLFSSDFNAYINVSYTYWGANYESRGCLMNMADEFKPRYLATYNPDKSVNIPALATPYGSSFRLFATEQDAMRYFEMCAESDLNFDPSQVYTGGSITINNNGDVTINNNSSSGGDDTPIDGSQMTEMIYNRLGEILAQVKQLKPISVADTIINTIDTLEGGIGQIADELVDSISQVFPFCILWDFVRIVKIFEAEPVSPVFEIPIKFVWINETITVDLTEYEALFALLRTGEIVLFLLGLFNITMIWVGKGDEIA